MNILNNKKYFILDMDGTFYLGDKLLDGSLRFVDSVKKSGKDFIFFTNNSSKSPAIYKDKLFKMGCPITDNQIITSGMVTAHYIKKRFENPRVFLVGTPPLEKSFWDYGIELTDDNVDAVVVGFDTTVNYDKLSTACTLIRNGAPFIASHPDFNCPTEDGFIPDCGAICALITASTGIEPKYLGKPYTETVDYITAHLKCAREDLVFVGDRLYTDIAIGVNHGIYNILVLTGETELEDVEKSTVKPDVIVNSLCDIIEFL